MDRTNKKLLDSNYKQARAVNFQIQYDKKMSELVNSRKIYTQAQLHAQSKSHAEGKLQEFDPGLQSKIYADFGGNKDAAQRQYKEWQRQKVEKQLEERKKRQAEKQQEAQQKAESARITQDSLREMQQRKNVRGQFNTRGNPNNNGV